MTDQPPLKFCITDEQMCVMMDPHYPYSEYKKVKNAVLKCECPHSNAPAPSEAEMVLDELTVWLVKRRERYGSHDSAGEYANDDPCNQDPFDCTLKKLEKLRQQQQQQQEPNHV